jgi:hypothetical protein
MDSTMYAVERVVRGSTDEASPRPTPHYLGQVEQIGQVLSGAVRRIEQIEDQLRPVISNFPVATNGSGEKQSPDKQPTELAECLGGLFETARKVESMLTALQNRIHL